MPLRGGLRWFIMGSAVIFVLERLGVSATVLWTALSGFVAVAAIAFFAMWSVLSNLLCAVLIFTVGPFRLAMWSSCSTRWTSPASKAVWWQSTCCTPP
jgi:small-conductance mechanosensitive channel